MTKLDFSICPIRVFVLCLWTLVNMVPQTTAAQFSKGADIGWLAQMEATGYKFYDSTGTERNCLDILQDHGINTVRLRVWVNPSTDKINGHCGKKEVAGMAMRAKNRGMRIMIDFHYSDSWADPGKQNKPAAWTSHTVNQLLTDLYNHTYDVLDTLKTIGATPEWVQVGNEITGGMLWPDGSTSNWSNLGKLLNKGYDAAKAVDSAIKVVIHLDQGNDNARFRTFFDNATALGVRYDVIGASYYPFWLGSDYTTTIAALGNNLNDMASRYGKEIMVVEVGGDYALVQNTYNMLVAVINKVKAVPSNKGLGVIYWEPEGEKSWSGYQLSCWGPDEKPTAALNAFLSGSTGLNNLENHPGLRLFPNPCLGGEFNLEGEGLSGTSVIRVFDITGRLMRGINRKNPEKISFAESLAPGLYVINVESEGRTLVQKLVVR